MNRIKFQELLYCFHCGNETLMPLLAEGKNENYDADGIGDEYVWYIFLCPVCQRITLKEYYRFSEDYDFDGKKIWSSKILYPQINTDTKLPPKIRNAYEAALKVRNIDGAICALSLRRTLEMICKDQGEEEGDLYNKLKRLSERNIMPPLLSDMATILRNLGNIAAHADDVEFPPDIVNSIIEFTRVILDYIYILPDKLAKIQTELSKEIEGKDSITLTINMNAGITKTDQ